MAASAYMRQVSFQPPGVLEDNDHMQANDCLAGQSVMSPHLVGSTSIANHSYLLFELKGSHCRRLVSVDASPFTRRERGWHTD